MFKRAIDAIFNLSRLTKLSIQIISDCALIMLSLMLAFSLRFDNFLLIFEAKFWYVACLIIPLTIFLFSRLGLYRAIIRYISQKAMLAIIIGVLLSSILLYCSVTIVGAKSSPIIPIAYFFILFLTIGGVRFCLRELYKTTKKDDKKKVAIYGAGDAGRQLLKALNFSLEYKPIIFIDDDVKLHNYEIDGISVKSFESGLDLLSKYHIKAILIAIPSASKSVLKNIILKLEKSTIEVKVVPGINSLIEGHTQISDLRPVSIEQLLGRDLVPPISSLLTKNITKKVVLVTGAGGSIGSELCIQILKQDPEKLILFDISEYAIFGIYQKLVRIKEASRLSVELYPFIGSVQNIDIISKVLKIFNVDTIYHAAAYKHVPLVEANVVEGFRNNLFGTLNIVKCAQKNGVKDFILISTDKAVRPTSFMGASKRMAELVCQAYSNKKSNTKLAIVRFGNVLGSSGSVIPQFEEQIRAGGPITLTHKDINRYFMTIHEAAELVIQAGSMADGGDVFVLDMGTPIKILELAKKMIRLHGLVPYIEDEDGTISGDIAIKVVGLRPGEKLFEELLIGENPRQTQHPRIMKAHEPYLDLKQLNPILDDINQAISQNNISMLAELINRTPTEFSTSRKSVDIILNNIDNLNRYANQ